MVVGPPTKIKNFNLMSALLGNGSYCCETKVGIIGLTIDAFAPPKLGWYDGLISKTLAMIRSVLDWLMVSLRHCTLGKILTSKQ